MEETVVAPDYPGEVKCAARRYAVLHGVARAGAGLHLPLHRRVMLWQACAALYKAEMARFAFSSQKPLITKTPGHQKSFLVFFVP